MFATSIPSKVAEADTNDLKPSMRCPAAVCSQTARGLLHQVVEEFDPHHLDRDRAAEALQHAVDRGDAGRVSTAFADHDLSGQAIHFQCTGEELGGGSLVAPFREHEIEGFTELVDSSAKINPRARHFFLGFIHPPGAVGSGLPASRVAGNQRRIFGNPVARQLLPRKSESERLSVARSTCTPCSAIVARSLERMAFAGSIFKVAV